MSKNRRTISVTLLVLVAFCFFSIAQQATPNFLNLIAVGDSLTAGFQSGSLNEKGQTNSYASLIARQVGTFLFLPLISSPGIPNELILVDPGPPPVLETAPGEGATRIFPLIVAQNLAIPGQGVTEALTIKPDLPLDSLEDTILGVPILLADFGIPPLSQIQLAFALRPTFTIFWLGNNDILGAALSADPSAVTPFETFQQAYATAVGTILASGSQMIVANIPNVTAIPFLTPAEEVAALVGAPLAVIGPALGIAAGDFVTAPGVPLVSAILSGQAAGPLPPNVVLTAGEAQTIVDATVEMNAYIAGVGASMSIPVVDIHGLFKELDENGITVDGVKLTTNFLGGLFSLDGIHPTNTGYAVVANAFIDKMNEFYGLSISQVDLAAVLAEDPLVFTKGGTQGHAPPAAMAIRENEFQSLAATFLPAPEAEADSAVDFSFESFQIWLSNLPEFNLTPGPMWVIPDP